MKLDRDMIVNRFLDYVSYDTQSSEAGSDRTPSTEKQWALAKHLAEELKEIGLSDVKLSDHAYVTATLPANVSGRPTVGFISHMDTAPDAPGGPVYPRIVRFDGNDVVLNEEKHIVFPVADFPAIQKYVGQDIIFTDGTTLLGADDKAGLTAIVTAMEYLSHHPEIPHGTIRIGFTPDEEIGNGTKYFDVKEFGADFTYTVDGGEIGGLEYETFNAANPVVTFHGRSVHTGDAKGKMVNAITLAAEWMAMLPSGEKPEYTEGREGFYHVYGIEGGVETCTLHMLVRDHDREKFNRRKQLLSDMAAFFTKKYGEGVVELVDKDVYYNMGEIMKDHMDVVDLARRAMEAVGVKPVSQPIRGGTDGAVLSFQGLPCPNLFTGGANYHGRFEYLPVPSLVKACETVVEIVKLAGEG